MRGEVARHLSRLAQRFGYDVVVSDSVQCVLDQPYERHDREGAVHVDLSNNVVRVENDLPGGPRRLHEVLNKWNVPNAYEPDVSVSVDIRFLPQLEKALKARKRPYSALPGANRRASLRPQS
jgi:hypothetical protein